MAAALRQGSTRNDAERASRSHSAKSMAATLRQGSTRNDAERASRSHPAKSMAAARLLRVGSLLAPLLGSCAPSPGTAPPPETAPPPGTAWIPAGGGVRGFHLDLRETNTADFADFVARTGHETEAERFGWSLVFHPPGAAPPEARVVPSLPWWVAVEGADWRHPRGPDHAPAEPDHPAVQVSWNDARAFCVERGGRLPTGAEWERAARGGASGSPFPWGDAPPFAAAKDAPDIKDLVRTGVPDPAKRAGAVSARFRVRVESASRAANVSGVEPGTSRPPGARPRSPSGPRPIRIEARFFGPRSTRRRLPDSKRRTARFPYGESRAGFVPGAAAVQKERPATARWTARKKSSSNSMTTAFRSGARRRRSARPAPPAAARPSPAGAARRCGTRTGAHRRFASFRPGSARPPFPRSRPPPRRSGPDRCASP